MAEETTASVIPLHQAPPKAKRGSGRAKVARPRKRQKPKTVEPPIPAEFLSADSVIAEPSVAQQNATAATLRLAEPVKRSRRQLAPLLLSTAALGLAAVGIIINGWFARSLGSSDVAGWLFLAVGVAADIVALVMPSCAAGLWQAGQRATALAGWGLWLMTFSFVVMAGIGFASVNIADVTQARAARVTTAVQTAQSALSDAMASRDRECKGGVGKFCREREATVADRRQVLDVAMRSVEQTADPQTEAAIRIVAWVSRGALHPTGDDFAMLRLVLLALLPQIGGILLMIGRSRA
jgi:hypothetical protein